MKTTKKKSVSETGHKKNVANFSSAYQILEEMSTLYNPSNQTITLLNLAPKKNELETVLEVLNNKIPTYKNAVANREEKIAPLGKLMTRTLNASKSSKISTTDKENLASQVKKIRGDAKPKKINPESSENEAISTSQMSYDSRIANFKAYISQLESHTAYAPNETDLQTANLRAYHQELETVSTLVNAAGNAVLTARANRNTLLYFNENNVIQLMKDIKSYVLSIGDSGKPYYKALVKLKFKDLNNKK